MGEAKAQYQQTGRAARLFKEFVYQTRESWSRARRVVPKAEHLEKGENPRFVVTSRSGEVWPAQALYEEHYCARGDMENRLKARATPSVWLCEFETRSENVVIVAKME